MTSNDVNQPPPGSFVPNPTRSGVRSGLTLFAAVMMMIGGSMAVFEGITAIAKDDLFVRTANYTFSFSLTSWGWIHLVLGIVLFLAGCALISGAVWARAVGVVMAALVLIANFLWLPYYPFWAIALIALNIFVIWALCAGTLREGRYS